MAYVEDCGDVGTAVCTPKLVFRDLQGNELYRFLPLMRSDGQPCLGGILQFEWIDRDRVGFSCHMNPSLSEYSVMSIAKAAPIADFFGGPFQWSPDKKTLAYGGPVVHFAPPSVKSFYLCLGDRLLYPAMKSEKGCNRIENPNMSELKGSAYIGIRDLTSNLAWRPDSRAIAFVECVYDWVPPTPSALNGGDEITRAYNLVIAPLTGPPFRTALIKSDRAYLKLSWTGQSTLEVQKDQQPPQVFRF